MALINSGHFITARLSKMRLQSVLFFGATILILGIGLVLSELLVAHERANLQQIYDTQSTSSATRGKEFLETKSDEHARNALMLTGVPPVTGYIRALHNGGRDPLFGEPAELWLDRLSTIFASLMQAHPEYAKVRIIGPAHNGREIIRVDRKNGRVIRAPASELQERGDADYFREATLLKNEQVYVSVINLNREFGKVELPPRPMVRFSTPIHSNGELVGIIVINVEFNSITNALSKLVPVGMDGYLTNPEGDFLWHPDSSKSFGFDLGVPHRLTENFPALTPRALSEINHNRIMELRSASSSRRVAIQRVQFGDAPYGRGMFLVISMKTDQIEPLVAKSRLSAMATMTVGAALILLFTWLALRAAFKPMALMTTAASSIANGAYDVALPAVGGAELFSLRLAFERMQAEVSSREQELREHRDNLQQLVAVATTEVNAIVQSAVSGIVTIDEHGLIKIFNPAAEKLFGWRADEVVGKNVSMLMGVPDSGQHGQYLTHYLETGEAKIIGRGREVTAVRKDGSRFPAHLAIGHAQFSETRHFFVAFLSDISLQKEHEATILKATADAQAAAQAKSEFLANMSHEIRTPMNGILGLCYLMEKQELPLPAREMLTRMRGAGRALLGLINDILDFSKIEARRLELEHIPFKLSDVLDNLASIMSAAVGSKPVEVIVGPAPAGAEFLCGDSLRLGQVLINLAGNAIKFTEQGEVVVQVIPISLDATANTAHLRFSVRDTGIGIPKDKQAAIFQAFSQADSSTTRSFGGTGLGLTISSRLVELMGGTLAVSSTPGQGSEFSFEINFDTSAPNNYVFPEMLHQRVLIADDQDTARGILAETVASIGWVADTVPSGQGAIEATLATDEAYDVLLLDWRMPGIDGVQTAVHIRENLTAESPIIVMVTAHDRDALQGHPNSHVADVVLTKPVTSSSLYNAVMQAKMQRGKLTWTHAVNPESAALRGLHLLIVDDSDLNREVAAGILAGEGATVELAEDGSAALTSLRCQPDAFDAVLMDMQMPVMDGYEATRQIRADPRLAKIPVIALTAGAFKQQREQALAAGVNDFVAKPFEVEQLINTLRTWTQQAENRSSAQAQHPPEAVPPHAPPQAGRTDGLMTLNSEKALRTIREVALYQDFLRRFANSHATTPLSIETTLVNDPIAATALAHKLKGAAAQLSLEKVAHSAGAIEAELHQGNNVGDLISTLKAAMTEALSAIEQFAPTALSASVDNQAASAEQIMRVLQQLLSVLDQDDSDAIDAQMAELIPLLPSERLTPLQAAVEGFDYRAAEAEARQLIASLAAPESPQMS